MSLCSWFIILIFITILSIIIMIKLMHLKNKKLINKFKQNRQEEEEKLVNKLKQNRRKEEERLSKYWNPIPLSIDIKSNERPAPNFRLQSSTTIIDDYGSSFLNTLEN